VLVAVFEHEAPLEDVAHAGLRVSETEAELGAARDEHRLVRFLTDEKDERLDEARLEHAPVAFEAMMKKRSRVAEQIGELEVRIGARQSVESRFLFSSPTRERC
jgi:hypothetical protein